MNESEPGDRLAKLGEEIERARHGPGGRGSEGRGDSMPQGAVGIAFRIGIELVAALCVGLAIGWCIDRFVGTKPWGLILFFFLGAAAGILNVYRAIQRMGLGGNPPPAQGR